MVEKIKLLLKSINYPGYSRDIISFGLISSIDILENNILIKLKFGSTKDENKKIICDEVTNKIKSEFSNFNVKISEEGSSQQADVSKRSIPGVKHIIAIASGKGGVGKSTIALNIALSLKKRFKVGLLDLDIYGPSLPMMVGEFHQPKLTKENKIIPVDQFGLKLMSFGFINDEQAPAIWRGPMVARLTTQFFNDVIWGDLDYLILDLPPGTGDIQLTMVQKLALDGVVMITTPQDLAVLDVKKGADMFAKLNTPIIGVVENMSGLLIEGVIKDHNGEPVKNSFLIDTKNFGDNIATDKLGNFQIKCDLFMGLGGKKESERLNVPLLDKIYFDPKLAASADMGNPYILKYPNSPIAKVFENISSKIETYISSDH